MKMQENKLKRFNIYSKVTNVLFILTIIFGALLTLVGTVLAIYLNVADIDVANAANFIFESELPGASLILPADFEMVTSIAYFIVLNTAVTFALIAYVLKKISNMFRHIVKEQTPFTQVTVRAAKGIGVSFLIYTAIVFVLGIITSFTQTELNVSFSIEWGMILLGLLIMALGEMFEFGMVLQEDNESIL